MYLICKLFNCTSAKRQFSIFDFGGELAYVTYGALAWNNCIVIIALICHFHEIPRSCYTAINISDQDSGQVVCPIGLRVAVSSYRLQYSIIEVCLPVVVTVVVGGTVVVSGVVVVIVVMVVVGTATHTHTHTHTHTQIHTPISTHSAAE